MKIKLCILFTLLIPLLATAPLKIKIQTDNQNPQILSSFNLAAQLVESIIQIDSPGLPPLQGLECDGTLLQDVEDNYSLLLIPSDHYQICIQHTTGRPLVAKVPTPVQGSKSFNLYTQLIVSSILRTLAFNEQVYNTINLAPYISYKNGQRYLVLDLDTMVPLEQEGLFLVQPDWMWSDSEASQSNLLLGDIHQKIIESTQLYTVTDNFPILSTTQTVANCDNQNGHKTKNGIQTESCQSGFGWEFSSGEWFGKYSACMKANIWLNGSALTKDDSDSRCLKYSCGNEKLTITVGNETPVVCSSEDETVQVNNYSGSISCKGMKWICNGNRVDGCLNDCNNQGVCLFGSCYCGESGCGDEKIENCSQAADGQCISCNDGYYLDDGQCRKCLSQCRKCSNGYSCDECGLSSCECDENEVMIEGECQESGNCENLYEDVCLECTLENCDKCLSTVVQSQVASECLVCSAGYYEFNGLCEQCPLQCATCEDGSSCTTCAEGVVNAPGCDECGSENQVVVNGACTCREGYSKGESGCVCALGYTSYQKECIRCHETCSDCEVVGSELVCSLCNDGYYLVDGACLRCPVGCQECNSGSICKECQSSFTLKDGVCQCDKAIGLLGGVFQCISASEEYLPCDPGWTLEGGKCVQCAFGCEQCSSGMSCVRASDGFYLSHQKPIECNPKCRVCNAAQCLECWDLNADPNYECSCNPGYVLSADYSCLASLTDCGDYYHLEQSACQFCPSFCLRCSSNTQCTACIDGYFLDEGQCSQCLPICAKCTSRSACTACANGQQACPCAEGQYMSLNTGECYDYTGQCDRPGLAPYSNYAVQCLACPLHCVACQPLSQYATRCTQCRKGFELQDNHCVNCSLDCAHNPQCHDYQQIQDKCYQCPGCQPGFCLADFQCLQCRPHFFSDQAGFCLQCSPRCQTCQHSATNCLACDINRTNPPLCSCLPNYFEDPQTFKCVPYSDQTCPQGMVLFQKQQCIPCPNNCKLCKSQSYDYALCSQCDDSYYWNVQQQQCLPCQSNCKTCTNNQECKECLPGFVQSNLCNCANEEFFGPDLCYKQCPSGTAALTKFNSERLCIDCGANCSSCRAFESQIQRDQTQVISICLECARGYYLENVCKRCSQKCKSCAKTASNCLECVDGKASAPLCLCPEYTDSSSSECLDSCAADQSVVNEDGMKICLSNESRCVVKDGKCTVCQQGYYLQGYECMRCNKRCSVCLNESACLACKEGTLIDNQCACQPNLLLVGDVCTTPLPCENGQWIQLSNRSLICAVCPTGCSLCDSQLRCQQCAESFYLTDDYACRQCPPRCKFCTSSSTCLQCLEQNNVELILPQCLCPLRYHLTLEGNCIYKTSGMSTAQLCPLPSTSYYNPQSTGSYCKDCGSGCRQCNNGVCTSCSSDYLLKEGVCVNCLFQKGCPGYVCAEEDGVVKGCGECPGNCQECGYSGQEVECIICDAGYWGAGCWPCPENCLECRDGSQCTRCADGGDCSCSSVLVNNVCVKHVEYTPFEQKEYCEHRMVGFAKDVECGACEEHCEKCYDESCYECADGYFLEDGGCRQCDPVCKKCASFNYCSECWDAGASAPECSCSGFYSVALRKCVDGCEVHDGYLQLLDRWSNKLCVECPQGCRQCDLARKPYRCSQCYPGFKLTQDACVRAVAECGYGYNAHCEKCSERCLHCTDDPNNCTQCVGDRVNPPRCQCPSLEAGGRCVEQCQPSMYSQDKTCRPCPAGCVACTSAASCSQCAQGYYLARGVCTRCQPQCLECVNGSECTKCRVDRSNAPPACPCAGFIDTLQDDMCIHATDPSLLCPLPFSVYHDNQCLLCDANCLDCQAQNGQPVCLKCQPGYQTPDCVKCGQNCDVCQYGVCKSCVTLHYFTPQGHCVSQCAIQCDSCLAQFDNCQKCSALRHAPPQCDCIDGYFEDAFTLLCLPNFYYAPQRLLAQAILATNTDYQYTPIDDTPYEKCEPMFYYLNDNTCLPCLLPHCLRCLPMGNKNKCYKCQTGYLLDPIREECVLGQTCNDLQIFADAKCVNCGYPCKKCTNLEQYRCLECDDGYYLMTSGLAFENKCKKCLLLHCLQCDGSKCVECFNNYKLTSDGQCAWKEQQTSTTPPQVKCEANQYIKDNKCNDCPQYCSACLLKDQVICTSCVAGFQLVENVCKSNCKESEYFDRSEERCQACSTGCQQCTSQYCEECLDNYDLKDGLCIKGCLEGHYFSQTSNECALCQENCLHCTYDSAAQALICLKCSPAYILIQGACVKVNSQTCPPNSSFVVPAQTSIPYCQPCQQGCSECRSSSDMQRAECVKCETGYSYESGKCTQVDQVVCMEEETIYFEGEKYECIECEANCEVCELYKNSREQMVCEECRAGYVLDESRRCVKAECEAGVVVRNKCVPCPEHCLACDEEQACEACVEGYSVIEGDCGKEQVECASNQYVYKAKDGLEVCLECEYPCSQCEGGNACLHCAEGHELRQGGCVSLCDSLEYYNQLAKACAACPLGCDACHLPYPFVEVQCTRCSAGYFLNENEECEDSKVMVCPMHSIYQYELERCTCYLQSLTFVDNQCVYPNHGIQCYDSMCLNCLGPLPSQCTQCHRGYYFDNRQCAACSAHCEHCDSSKCQLCEKGYFLSGVCTPECPTGYLPFVDSLYHMNPELFPLQIQVNTVKYGHMLGAKYAIAIASEGVSVFNHEKIPFDYFDAQIFATYKGQPIRAECLPCIKNCFECPDGFALLNERCYPPSQVHQGTYIKSDSLDPLGYQSTQLPLLLQIDFEYGHLKWSLDNVYALPSTPKQLRTFDNYNPPDAELLPVQVYRDQLAKLHNQLAQGGSTLQLLNLSKNMVYAFSALVDDRKLTIFVPVLNIPLHRHIEELGTFDLNIDVSPLVGNAIRDTFTAYYNFLGLEDLLTCSDNGPIFLIQVYDINQQWRISRSSAALQLYFDFKLPYLDNQKYVTIQFTIHCRQYQYIAFRKVHAKYSEFNLEEEARLVGEKNYDIYTLLFMSNSLFNRYAELLRVRANLVVEDKSSEGNGRRMVEWRDDEYVDFTTYLDLSKVQNVYTSPFNYSKSCPPNDLCSGQGECMQHGYLFECACKSGYGGLNCQLNSTEVEQFSELHDAILQSMATLPDIHLSDLNNKLHSIMLLTQMETLKVEHLNDTIQLLADVSSKAYDALTVSLAYASVSQLSQLLMLPSFQQDESDSFYKQLYATTEILNRKQTLLLLDGADQQFQSSLILTDFDTIDLTLLTSTLTLISNHLTLTLPVSLFHNYRTVISSVNVYPQSMFQTASAVRVGKVYGIEFYARNGNAIHTFSFTNLTNDTNITIRLPLPSDLNITQLAKDKLVVKCKWFENFQFVSSGCLTEYDENEVVCVCSHLSMYSLVIGSSEASGPEGDAMDNELPPSVIYPVDNNFTVHNATSPKVSRPVEYQDFSDSTPFIVLILTLTVYIVEMMIGYWFDKQQEEEFVLSDITEVELKNKVISVSTYLIAIIILRNPVCTLAYFHPTLPRPLRLMFSLTKVLLLYTICAFIDDNDWFDGWSIILVNFAIVPVTAVLTLLKNYLARSRRLIALGYVTTLVLISLMLVLAIIEGIESEPRKYELDRWGQLMINCLVWEILLFDSWKALGSLFIFRSIVADGESSAEQLIDQQEMKQFYKTNTREDHAMKGFQSEQVGEGAGATGVCGVEAAAVGARQSAESEQPAVGREAERAERVGDAEQGAVSEQQNQTISLMSSRLGSRAGTLFFLWSGSESWGERTTRVWRMSCSSFCECATYLVSFLVICFLPSRAKLSRNCSWGSLWKQRRWYCLYCMADISTTPGLRLRLSTFRFCISQMPSISASGSMPMYTMLSTSDSDSSCSPISIIRRCLLCRQFMSRIRFRSCPSLGKYLMSCTKLFTTPSVTRFGRHSSTVPICTENSNGMMSYRISSLSLSWNRLPITHHTPYSGFSSMYSWMFSIRSVLSALLFFFSSLPGNLSIL